MSNLTIMITGASRGIGLSTARLLAKHGHNLALFSNEPMDSALADKPLNKAVQSKRVVHGVMDVRSGEDWDTAIQQTITEFGQIDVLINNAGVLVSGNLPSTDLDHQLAMIDINCKGVLIGCHKVVEHMPANQNSKIINLSSASAIYGQPEIANYSATKFYVRGLTEALSIEYAKQGIKVVDVMPLWVVSDLTHGVDVTSISRLGINLSTDDVAKVLKKLVNTSNKKVKKTHYPVGMPAKILDNLAQITPSRMVHMITKRVSG